MAGAFIVQVKAGFLEQTGGRRVRPLGREPQHRAHPQPVYIAPFKSFRRIKKLSVFFAHVQVVCVTLAAISLIFLFDRVIID